METQLTVIGVNHRTSPVAIRERFWFGERRLYEALRRLFGLAELTAALRIQN